MPGQLTLTLTLTPTLTLTLALALALALTLTLPLPLSRCLGSTQSPKLHKRVLMLLSLLVQRATEAQLKQLSPLQLGTLPSYHP